MDEGHVAKYCPNDIETNDIEDKIPTITQIPPTSTQISTPLINDKSMKNFNSSHPNISELSTINTGVHSQFLLNKLLTG